MSDSNLVDLVRRSLSDRTLTTFEQRVDEQAERLREEIRTGQFDNPRYTVGLELEAYAVDGEGRLAKVPDAVFETEGCNGELGRHNVEITTAPDAFDADGVAAQIECVRERVAATRRRLDDAGLELVLDAMWTVPPSEGTDAYLSEVDVEDGVTIAENMRPSARYCALDNAVLAQAGGAVELDLPGVSGSFPTILVESLTSSIQPHLLVPDTETFPAHYAVGIRTLGPVLALATNSPFLPADLYDLSDGTDPTDRGGRSTADSVDPYDVVDRAFHEHRIPVFEQSVNTGAPEEVGRKVRFPRDVQRAVDVVDHLVEDRTCAPFLKEWVQPADAVETYADRVWELDHKRGTYWRWLRAVPGGEAVAGTSQRSLRIEYRPLPTQPTVADIVAFQALVSGLIRGLVAADHPIGSLSWDAARRCFYDVVENGLDAELAWIDADGDRTDDPRIVYEEVFEYARAGLREQGLSRDRIGDYLAPVEARWTERTTPSHWKKQIVRDRLDSGDDLSAAIESMQQEYVERSRSGEPFAEWELT